MLSLLGRGLEFGALLACAVGIPLGWWAGKSGSLFALTRTRWAVNAFAVCTIAAALVMEVALISHDFSVSYVAQVGSLATPLHITIVSLWSSLEGSILFWAAVLGVYAAWFARRKPAEAEPYMGYALSAVLVVGLFFSFLLAGPADPFVPTPAPVPTDGPGPNPLLQNHLLMIIHPPALYLGYVGMTIPFAIAVAALAAGKVGPAWGDELRKWLLVPIAFLTMGIMLGGWWSYEVLGWGGYWAWDPVENASFLPWLTAIAALHSVVVMRRKGSLKAWTMVLVLVTFLLTILGTFLTRSGVVNSVHSFTQSPIGPLFLGFLGVISIAVIILLALRVDRLEAGPTRFRADSRENAFLWNNLILVGMTFTVLVGTLFPILKEALQGVKVSVGEPYFNRMSVPMFFALLLLMAWGPSLPWGGGRMDAARPTLLAALGVGAVAVVVLLVLGTGWATAGTLGACAIASVVTIRELVLPAMRRRGKGERVSRAVVESTRRSPARFGGYLAHLGLIVTFAAIAISSLHQESAERVLAMGETLEVGGYQLVPREVAWRPQPHLDAQVAVVDLSKGDRKLPQLEPALNHYRGMREPLGTPAVRTALTHDLYLTLMSVGDGVVGIRAIVTPAVLWVWIGPIILILGTLIALVPARQVKKQ